MVGKGGVGSWIWVCKGGGRVERVEREAEDGVAVRFMYGRAAARWDAPTVAETAGWLVADVQDLILKHGFIWEVVWQCVAVCVSFSGCCHYMNQNNLCTPPIDPNTPNPYTDPSSQAPLSVPSSTHSSTYSPYRPSVPLQPCSQAHNYHPHTSSWDTPPTPHRPLYTP